MKPGANAQTLLTLILLLLVAAGPGIRALLTPRIEGRAPATEPMSLCNQHFALLEDHPAEQLLQRTLTPAQRDALENIRATVEQEHYTPSQALMNQRVLKKAGFNDSEITQLRRAGLLGKWESLIDEISSAPVETASIPLRDLDAATLKEIQSGKSYHYVITAGDTIHLTESELGPSEGAALMVADAGRIDSEPVLAQEAGILRYDTELKDFAFEPKYRLSLDEETASEFTPKDLEGVPFSRMIECTRTLKKQASGAGFVSSRIFSDQAITFSGLMGSELLGAHRLASDEGRDVILSDMIGTTVNSAIAAGIGKQLALRKFGIGASLAIRTASAMGMIEVQKNIYKNVLRTNADERAERIAMFDRVHFAARLPINHVFDKFLINQLPYIVYNSCLQGGKAAVFLSPTLVRVYERVGSTLVYYGLRKAIANE